MGLPKTPTMIRLKSPLPPDRLWPVSFRGVEAISEPYSFELEMTAPLDAEVPFDALMGKSIGVELVGKERPTRYFHGVVYEFEQKDDDAYFQHFAARLVPEFFLLTRTTQSRIFQNQTAPDILRTVLQNVRNVVVNLKEEYPAHNYCVQYDESDFDFACRLMAEEGIFFYFVHEESMCRMVLADRSATCPKMPAPSEIRFDRVRGGVRDEFRIHEWTKRQRIRTRKVTVRDYHFQSPGQNLQATASNASDIHAGAVAHGADCHVGELYLPNAGFAHRQDAISSSGAAQSANLDTLNSDNGRVANLHRQIEAAQSLEISGASNAWSLCPGLKFELKRHGIGDGGYLAVRVEHEAKQAPPRSNAAPSEPSYRNVFSAIPETLPYRPKRLPSAPYAEMQTATVVGSPGEQVHTDAYARIKAQFHWDRQHQFGPDSSCWLRPIQPMAGKNYGFHTIPRVGQEAFVLFQHGDADQPILWGGMYNPDQMPPFPLPDNRTQTGFKSQTVSGDSPNYSGFAIDARDGAESAHYHSEKDMQFSVTNTHYNNTGNSRFENYSRGVQKNVGGPFTNIAMSSSSSGAGSGDPINKETHPSYGSWTTAVSSKPWAQDMDLVMGHKLEGLIGIYFEPTYGCHTATVINPFGVMAALGVPAAVAGAAFPFGLFGKAVASQGNCGAVFGTSAALIYGPAYKISRGPIVDHTYDKPGAMTTGIKVAAFAYFLVCVSQFLARMIENDDDGDAIDLLLAALQEIVFSIWFGLEITNFYDVELLKPKTIDAAKVITELAAKTGWAGLMCAPSIGGKIVRGAEQIAAGNAAALGSEALLTDVQGVPANHRADSLHTVIAPAITLVSCPDPEDVETGISFEAMGVDDEGGILAIAADNAVHMAVGTETYIDMVAEETAGAILVDPGEGGIVFIRSGEEEIDPGILLGPPGIAFSSLTDIVFTVDVSVLTLAIEAATIELCSGASTLTVTPASITFNSPVVKVTGDGVVARTTPVKTLEAAEANFAAAVQETL